MADDSYGPFDTSPWSQGQWYRFAQAWAPDQIITPGDFALTFTGLSASLGTGRAWIHGAGYERTASWGGTVAANTSGTLSRRDRLVLRRDLANKTVTPTLLQGTPASTPAPPALTQNEIGVWDLPLWSFLVPPASGTAITGLTDERPAPPSYVLAQDTGWINISSINANYAVAASGARSRVLNGVCYFEIAVARNTGTITNPETICTMPVGHRPTVGTFVFQATGSPGGYPRASVNILTSGAVSVVPEATGASTGGFTFVAFSGCYPVT